MKGDFTRNSFDATKRFYRVLMQQGRVQLDADWNEQAAIMLHVLETMIRDIVGPYGGPADNLGFTIFPGGDGNADFGYGNGNYYVGGLLCENDAPAEYRASGPPLAPGHAYIVYLDAWEEFVSPAQDETIAEPALAGIDTTARSRIAWRVRALQVDELPTREEVLEDWPAEFLPPALIGTRGQLAARADPEHDVEVGDPALGVVRSGYHGAENQLYRVEIHDASSAPGGATFKWSRENGSVAFAIRAVAGSVVTIDSFGRDARSSIAPGDWVEIGDDDDAGAGAPARGLFCVAQAEPASRTVTLKTAPHYTYDPKKHPQLRRWDQGSAPIAVAETAGHDGWTDFEDGIEIRFAPNPAGDGPCVYRTGDYWTIPARTAEGGSILWPRDDQGRPALRDPDGITHGYAPLGGIHVTASGVVTIDRERHDYRQRFRPLVHRA
jgi:uncharacterized protein DUF6519